MGISGRTAKVLPSPRGRRASHTGCCCGRGVMVFERSHVPGAGVEPESQYRYENADSRTDEHGTCSTALHEAMPDALHHAIA